MISNLLFSPTIMFIYIHKEIKNIFEDDKDYSGFAYKTSKPLPNNRIGLIGVGIHANSQGLKRGLQQRPLRVVAGIVHVLVGSVLTCTGLGLFL